ncbi:MAG: MATE family efflux transporter [Bacilli bacterium]|nr:MATE family efflux transporter [Bacilli bacterium]
MQAVSNIDIKQKRILYDKNILKGIFLLALPIMFNNIVKALHDVVDMFVVGQMDAPADIVSDQIAAIGFVGPVLSIFQALALGVMIAGSALMSQYIGAKKKEDANKISGQLLIICTIIGLLFNVLLYLLCPTILKLMNAEANLYDYSLAYLRIRSFEMIGLFIFFAYQATRQSMGDTVMPVIFNVISIILNIVLTCIFVLVLNMDLKGAAYATVIANMILVPLIIVHMRLNKDMRITKESLKFDFNKIKQIFRLAWPSAVSQAFTSLGFLIINSVIADYNDGILSAIAIGNRINSMLLFPSMGVGSVLATFVGQNIGAGNIKRAKKSFNVAMCLSLMIGIIGGLILLPFRPQLAGIFLPAQEDIDLCVKYLFYLLVGLPLMSIFQCFNGCFQGAGRTGYSLMLSTIRLWVLRVPVLLLMLYVFDIGEQAVWLCMVVSNFGACILGTILYQFVDFLPRVSTMKKRLEKIT